MNAIAKISSSLLFAGPALLAASLVSAAGTTPMQPAPSPPTMAPPTDARPVPAPQSSRTVTGLKLDPDGGSGPDRTQFNIVDKKEAAKQQGRLHSGAGHSMTSDGTGGNEPSGGN